MNKIIPMVVALVGLLVFFGVPDSIVCRFGGNGLMTFVVLALLLLMTNAHIYYLMGQWKMKKENENSLKLDLKREKAFCERARHLLDMEKAKLAKAIDKYNDDRDALDFEKNEMDGLIYGYKFEKDRAEQMLENERIDHKNRKEKITNLEKKLKKLEEEKLADEREKLALERKNIDLYAKNVALDEKIKQLNAKKLENAKKTR